MSFGNGNGKGEILVSTPLETRIGTFGGTLGDVPATNLGATLGRGVVGQPGIEGGQASRVLMGDSPSAGQGTNPGRRVGIKSGLPVANARGRS